MRVLVTRPEPAGERTAARLAALGHDPVLMPLFEPRVTAMIDDLPPAARISGLIATSARAFAMFEGRDVSETGFKDVVIHAVGPATAQAARDAGFADVREGGGTAQALAKVLTDNRTTVSDGSGAVPSRRARSTLIYLAGVPRTAVIEDALKAADRDYLVLDCYRMDEISYSTDILKSDILSPLPDVVLLYSANAARRFSALAHVKKLENSLKSSRFLCLSAAVASELPEEWQGRAVVAEQPNEDSLLASLVALG